MSNSNIDIEKRLSLSFHRTFPLNRQAIINIVELAIHLEGVSQITNKIILQQTNLGSVYSEAMPRYAIGTGLLNMDRTPTQFGKIAMSNDPLLIHPSTQWLMHFHISSPNGPGPFFWYRLVTKFFVPGEVFSGNDLLDFISEENTGLKPDTIQEAKTVFVGTYTKEDGLGALNLIKDSREKGLFQVQYPDPPPLWAMAVAFLFYSYACFPGLRMINLDDIVNESDFGRIFMVGTRRLNQMLRLLQEAGYIDLFTTAPPYGIALLHTETNLLLEKMYGVDESD